MTTQQRARLWIEFVLFFIGGPLLLAAVIGGDWLFAALWAWTAIGIILLARTPGFSWKALTNWPRPRDYWRVAFMAIMVLLMSLGFTWLLFPERLFAFPKEMPAIWLMVMLFYPVLSAFPQELIFRALYFERYRDILPKTGLLTMNAAVFSFAHLVYAHPVVFFMTFLGGLVFARAYLRGEFPLAVLLHSIAGNMIFTSGLGQVFCASCGLE